MVSRHLIFSIFLLGIIQVVCAQTDYHTTGLLPDDGTYEQLERKNDLLTRDYTALPSNYSLLKYCPSIKDQDKYSTCTGWATAYAARTISEAVKYGWTDKNKINAEAFSPVFVYALIKDKYAHPDDYNCQFGTNIYKALHLMKYTGVAKLSSFNLLCANSVSEAVLQKAQAYRIDDYFTLFSLYCSDKNEKIRKVKKALSENYPVIIAMHIPGSFHFAKQTWNGQTVDPSKHGYHAMCVVGYDDNRQGGAFQIMNSWGIGWGDNGFVWVRYQDFATYVDQAYEIYLRKEEKPKPSPDNAVNPTKPIGLSGQIELQLSTGNRLRAMLENKAGICCYKVTEPLISGTRYRVYISNNEPAYIYVIGSDLTGSISKVFPPKDHISAALTYRFNHIAIPDERYYIEMDNTVGTDYMCVLYSKYPLDINAVINQMASARGSFYQKIQIALGSKLFPSKEIRYKETTIKFEVPLHTSYTVVPIVVEIQHK